MFPRSKVFRNVYFSNFIFIVRNKKKNPEILDSLYVLGHPFGLNLVEIWLHSGVMNADALDVTFNRCDQAAGSFMAISRRISAIFGVFG